MKALLGSIGEIIRVQGSLPECPEPWKLFLTGDIDTKTMVASSEQTSYVLIPTGHIAEKKQLGA
jgi:hypothetical protein